MLKNKNLGGICPKCGMQMIRRKRTKLPTGCNYYFSEWDYCSTHNKGCGYIQHYEKFKVFLVKK